EVGNESYYSDVQTLIPNGQPFMIMAGYGDTYIDHTGGNLDIIAWAMDADGDIIDSVEMYYGGQTLNFPLPSLGDGIFQITLPLPAGMVPFQEVFELVAIDDKGTPSGLWPYLNVRQTAWSASGYDYWMQQHIAGVVPWWYTKSRTIANPPDGNGPFIYAAGYNMSRVSTEAGGELNLIAMAIDYQDQITGMELFYAGMPTGLFLKDDGKSGDFAAADGVFGMKFSLGAGSMPAMDYLLEVRAYNNAGQESDIWPYFTVH
ncbi:hypothetical protein K8T06_06825, partial [bacterium]|nr:hypothetical protein [bacterium]